MTSRESLPAESDIVAELHAVHEVVEEFYILLDHIWRNRDELDQIFASPSQDRVESMPQNIRCAYPFQEAHGCLAGYRLIGRWWSG